MNSYAKIVPNGIDKKSKKMRQSLFILIFISYLAAIPCMAEEFLMGTVTSLDKENGKMTIQPDTADVKNAKSETNTPDKITVMFESENLPGCVEKGKIIRVWGDYVKEKTKTLKAKTIKGAGFRGHENDPTGVRCRLGKGRGKGKGKGRGRHRGCGRYLKKHQE
ncbi:MAG: hypothetical protein GY749_18005 [Desulfobacteraceae bacterium]|nr:hypothetical protein [Desulfobacteraceae bacterium]